MGIVQLDPIEIDTPDPDEEERERVRAEAMRALAESGADERLAREIERANPAAVARGAAEARSVGDAMRAAGPNPNPPPGIPTGVGNVRGHYYPPPEPPPSAPITPRTAPAAPPSAPQQNPRPPVAAQPPSSQQPPAAAPSGIASALASDSAPPPPAPPPDARARVAEYLAGKGGSANHTPITARTAPSMRRIELEEADHTGADVGDGFLSPLRAIGRFLRAAGGRPGSTGMLGAQGSLGAQSRARAREEDEQAAGENAVAERTYRAEVSAQNQADATAQRRDAATELADVRRRGLESLEQHRQQQDATRRLESEALIAQRNARADQIRAVAGQASERDDPDSDVSERRREAFRIYVGALPEQLRSQVGEIDGDALERMSATDIDAIWAGTRQGLGSMRHSLSRRGSGGGGLRSAASRAALDEPPEGWRGSPEQWRALSPRDRRQAIRTFGTRQPRAGDDDGEGVEIMPGVRARLVDDVAARQVTAGLAAARAQAANLRGLGEAARGGANQVMSPSARAAVVPRLTIGRGMVAELGNTGVINEGEVPTINAALPNPNDLEQMTLGTFRARLETWESLLRERIDAQLQVYGVDDAGRARALRWLSTGSLDDAPQQQGRTVAADEQPEDPSAVHRYRLPDGRVVRGPAGGARAGWTDLGPVEGGQ